MTERIEVNQVFYVIGKILFLPMLLLGIWFSYYGFDHSHKLFTCYIRTHLGMICPGCGGTRAVYYLFRGEFLQSLYRNPAVLTGVICYFHFMLTFSIQKHMQRENRKPIRMEGYVYLVAGVLILQWILKLIFLFTR